MKDLHVTQKELGSNKFSQESRNSIFGVRSTLAKDALFNHTRELSEIQSQLPRALRTHANEFNFIDRYKLHPPV